MTILGKHTVAETRDLMKVVQYRFDEVEKAFKTISAEWKAAHPEEWHSLETDWNLEKQHWDSESKRVSQKLTFFATVNPLVANDLIAAEDEYKSILGFVEYGASSGVERRKGDLRDCQARIEAAIGHPVDLSKRPDISQSNDPDLNAYKKADTAIKTGEAAAKGAIKSNTGLLIGAGVLLGLGTVVAVKVYL